MMDSLDQIITQIKQYQGNLSENDSESFWKNLFIDQFVDDKLNNKQDDLLFFIYKNDFQKHNNKSLINLQPKIDVRRKFSPNLPLNLSSINWEESLFLNIILQKLEYSIIYSVCTRTSSTDYQVISKQKLNVFATPSSHSVLFKESAEQYSYPFINFYIENFEEFLYENVINNLESIYFELVVNDFISEPFVIFSSWVNYQSINDSYGKENRIIFNGQYFGVLQLTNSIIEGKAEIVVKKKIKRSVSDGSTFSIVMDLDDTPDTALDLYLHNLNRKNSGIRNPPNGFNHSFRRTGKCSTIESSDIFPDLSDDLLTDMWSQEGFIQTYFQWRERQKCGSNSFHCFVTNITMPWYIIVNQLFQETKKRTSLLLV